MKINKFFMGLGAVAALSMAACSNDEPANPGNDPVNPSEGESIAYMTVTLSDVNSRSRATAGDFENGTDTEHAVRDAYFYFYTAEGAYVTTAEVWDGGSATEPNQNVEFEGKTVLVLKDLNEKSAPKYIVTVLNKPEGFEPGSTLQEMEAKLSYLNNGVENYMSDEYFVMSTASFDWENASVENTYEYFTTPVTDEAFLKYPYGQEPKAEDLNTLKPVEIYVERLAAKVGVSLNLAGDNVVTIGNETYAKLTVSKGNVVNNENGTITSVPVASSDLYIKIEGWGLNNLAKNEYMMKNLLFNDKDFNWTGWNAKQYNRSYWAKSFVYEADSYTDNIAHYALKDFATVTTDEAGEVTAAEFNEANLAGTNLYCPENTNRASVLKQDGNLGSIATSAMIFARIYEKTTVDGVDKMVPATMVSYNGIMYNDDDFVAMVLNAVQNTTATNAKKFAFKTIEGEKTVFKTIDADDIALVSGAKTQKGQVIVELTEAAAAKEWYSYTGALTENENDYTKVDATAVNAALNNVIANVGEAYCYNGGLMYYNVPIEHFGPGTDYKSFEEGFYGVVRNHKYALNINSLTKLGNAIYDPDEEIIPDSPKDEFRYALGVKIRILSWKLVNQNVDL